MSEIKNEVLDFNDLSETQLELKNLKQLIKWLDYNLLEKKPNAVYKMEYEWKNYFIVIWNGDSRAKRELAYKFSKVNNNSMVVVDAIFWQYGVQFSRGEENISDIWLPAVTMFENYLEKSKLYAFEKVIKNDQVIPQPQLPVWTGEKITMEPIPEISNEELNKLSDYAKKNLKSRGKTIKDLQEKLGMSKDKQTGVFDKDTYEVLKKFQKDNWIDKDLWYLWPKTLNLLWFREILKKKEESDSDLSKLRPEARPESELESVVPPVVDEEDHPEESKPETEPEKNPINVSELDLLVKDLLLNYQIYKDIYVTDKLFWSLNQKLVKWWEIIDEDGKTYFQFFLCSKEQGNKNPKYAIFIDWEDNSKVKVRSMSYEMKIPGIWTQWIYWDVIMDLKLNKEDTNEYVAQLIDNLNNLE